MRDRTKEDRAQERMKERLKKLRRKLKNGEPLVIGNHLEDCTCYDCLWGENRDLRRLVKLDYIPPDVKIYRKH